MNGQDLDTLSVRIANGVEIVMMIWLTIDEDVNAAHEGKGVAWCSDGIYRQGVLYVVNEAVGIRRVWQGDGCSQELEEEPSLELTCSERGVD